MVRTIFCANGQTRRFEIHINQQLITIHIIVDKFNQNDRKVWDWVYSHEPRESFNTLSLNKCNNMQTIGSYVVYCIYIHLSFIVRVVGAQLSAIFNTNVFTRWYYMGLSGSFHFCCYMAFTNDVTLRNVFVNFEA